MTAFDAATEPARAPLRRPQPGDVIPPNGHTDLRCRIARREGLESQAQARPSHSAACSANEPANTSFPTFAKNLEEMTMMTRRNFFLATAAGAAVLSRSTNLFAATYDLIIKGGHVIDPSLRTAASAEPPHWTRR
jgi:hypothetical protein